MIHVDRRRRGRRHQGGPSLSDGAQAYKGRSRVLPPAFTELARAQHRAHPGWTAQLHHDNLAVLLEADTVLGPMPSYSTLRRFLRANGLERRQTSSARALAPSVLAIVTNGSRRGALKRPT